MNQHELLQKDSLWMQKTEEPQIVICSRVRLARNLERTPFSQMLNQKAAKQVAEEIVNALEKIRIGGQSQITDVGEELEARQVVSKNADPSQADPGETDLGKAKDDLSKDGIVTANPEKLTYFHLNSLSEIELRVLQEKHLISKELVRAKKESGVALTWDHRAAIMVNEEDHLRIQVLDPGDMLAEAYRMASRLDDSLEGKLDFAYRERQGYLTACPTNVGTGLRASVMVHLPALVMTNQAQQILGTLAHLGLAVRGLYGEGSQSLGHIFQVSNQITLGKSEEDIIAHLEAVTKQIIEMEMNAREAMRKQVPLTLEDKVWRARGILQNARILTFDEAIRLLSLDCLGSDMGFFSRNYYSFASLLVNVHPGCLQYYKGSEMDPVRRDQERALMIRKAMRKKSSPER